jgi:ribosome-associated translation inhibitor RaiA
MNCTQITLRNMRRSTALNERIRKMSEQRQLFHPHILRCRVAVEAPSLRKERGGEFTVSVTVHVPGREIVASHGHEKDVLAALSGAFDAARRQLLEASKTKQYAGIRLHQTQGEAHEK